MNKPKCRYIYSPVQIAECGGPCEQGPEHCDCGELWITAPEPEGPTDEDLVETVRQSMEDCIFVSELLYYNREPLMQILRAVLTRWGNHPESPDCSGNLKAGLTRCPDVLNIPEFPDSST